MRKTTISVFLTMVGLLMSLVFALEVLSSDNFPLERASHAVFLGDAAGNTHKTVNKAEGEKASGLKSSLSEEDKSASMYMDFKPPSGASSHLSVTFFR